MSKSNLVIVESPAKAKTISKFLGKEYVVKASMGHVRDLPKSKMGIDVEGGTFEPVYQVSPEKKKVITDLKKHAGEDVTVWIATDEDREGEAIGWHLVNALKLDKKDGSEKDNVHRIVFHEITKPAILAALANPRTIDRNLVDAQQARRVLDRLVGYELSPLLWKKIRYGLSAGRVQSVAVRLIVEREREIRAFKPEEYWSVLADYVKDGKKFQGALSKIDGKKAVISNKETADKIFEDLKGAAHTVTSVERKEVRRAPAAPFTTSTLQQEAARKLGFSVKKTMTIAQHLYEGVEVNGETKGIITYMRTDSVNLSQIATAQAREVIEAHFGKEFALEAPRLYKGKKGAQEAHEAIRPVDLSIIPEQIKDQLEKDEIRLYELIWKRTIACQMKEALLEQVGVDIATSVAKEPLPYTFRATGQTVLFSGFMKAYTEDKDEDDTSEDDGEKLLPILTESEKLDCKEITPNQHFTKPPARYTEASLVKKLESEGIGRPSTYAPTISTVIDRGYVLRDKRQLSPTDLAEVVTDMLVEHFPSIVDVQFTAKMEEDLDGVAEGKQKWVPLIKAFYDPFHAAIVEKDATLKKSDIVNSESTEMCEKCGKPMVIKLGRFGKFLSCSNYPTCKNAKPIEAKPGEAGANGEVQVVEKSAERLALEKSLEGKMCEKCGKPMAIKRGRFGEFLGCTGYPECKNLQSITISTGIKCPECGKGELVEKKTRKGGRAFYGCNKYPKCKFASWDKPIKTCEKCNKGVITESKDGEQHCSECNPKPQKKGGDEE